MTFREAVEATPDIKTCFQNGLTALGNHSRRVMVADSSMLQGSVDIDSCTKKKYPNSNRWDYVFAYKNEVFFVEIHSAHTTKVSTVLKKLKWLKEWLNSQAPELNKIRLLGRKREQFVWIQSKNFQIPPGTPQYRAAINAGLLPKNKFILD